MNKIRRYVPALLVIWILCMSYSLSDRSTENPWKTSQKNINLIIHFKAVVNGQPFVTGKNYINSFNEPFSIEKFRFYFCKVRLIDIGTRSEIPAKGDEYFLIDFADSIKSMVRLSLAPGKYSNIVFLLGVDSIHNTSGAQSGALDPAKGMFWTWNSGYVMAKLEGNSILSNQPSHAITYHIGGYREPDNVSRTINLTLPAGKELDIHDGKISELYISADINYWFIGPHPFHINEIPTCTTPGMMAKNISENYANMFSILQPIN